MGNLDKILALERRVWDALVAGDAGADAALLGDDFIGLYSTGFGNKAEHVAQLAAGPTVARYALSQARLIDLGAGCVLLAYRALYLRRGAAEEEAMYVASIWRETPEGWRNIFSQDTAEGGPAPV